MWLNFRNSDPVENGNRHTALNRQNALFAGHDEGVGARVRIASLIETARASTPSRYAL